MAKNFAIIGCGGFVAPRHLQAIKETGNVLVAALDKSDSVGILDKYFSEADFFTEFERFDRHAEKLKRMGEDKRIHFVSICSPNYLHDAHIRFAFRIGADAICEKPLVINPWNLDALEKLEKETGKRVYNLLQLRYHPSILKLKKKLEREEKKEKYDIELTYITPRGKWYDTSWKGDVTKSGGIIMNLGIHFFDMLIWLFGDVIHSEVHFSDNRRMGGYLELEKARVKWFLSTKKEDLPNKNPATDKFGPYRLILIDGEELEFSDGFTDLHTESYKQILKGNGCGIKDARPAIELSYRLRNSTPLITDEGRVHNLLKNSFVPNSGTKNYYLHPSVVIDEKVEIGEGTKVWCFSHILSNTIIGKNCTVGQNVTIGPNVKIGSNCKIQNNVSVYDGVELEEGVFCGPSMVFTNIPNPRAFINRKNDFKKTLVKRGATIGANATIISGVTIGKYAFIGASAVVTRNVPDYALMLGVPAKQEGWVCECGEIITRQINSDVEKVLRCKNCLKNYRHYLSNFSLIDDPQKNENRIL